MIWAVKLLVVEDNAMNQMVIKMINKNGWIQPFCMLITVKKG
jgi:hypothetical protein